MPQLDQATVRNRLLKSLSSVDFDALAGALEPVELPLGLVLETPYQEIERVVFIESGIVSRIVIGTRGEAAECGPIGFEGITAKPIILGGRTAINSLQVQVAGHGLAVSPDALQDAIRRSADLMQLMHRYVLACEIQTEHSLLSLSNDPIGRRLARWLLMYQDRTEGTVLSITHDLLSDLLNVRRSSVTDQLHVLEGIRAIRATRGTIEILDRSILIDTAAGSYGHPEQEFARLFPIPAHLVSALPA